MPKHTTDKLIEYGFIAGDKYTVIRAKLIDNTTVITDILE